MLVDLHESGDRSRPQRHIRHGYWKRFRAESRWSLPAGKQPVVRLVPFKAQKKGPVFVAMRGRARVDRRFFEPSPDEESEAWAR